MKKETQKVPDWKMGKLNARRLTMFSNKVHGFTVRDSVRNSHVEVKPSDIQGAVCRDHQECVVARALKRHFKADWVDVGNSTAFIKVGKVVTRYRLPAMAQKQVRFFDENDGRFAPCEVKLLKTSGTSRALGACKKYKKTEIASKRHDYPKSKNPRRRPTR